MQKKPFYKKPVWCISIILSIFFGGKYIFNFNFNKTEDNDKYDNKGAVFEDVTCQGDGCSAEKTEINQIPYTNKIITYEYRQLWDELNNILYILPNNKKAYLPLQKNGYEYILAYSNEDCSEIKINETYELPPDYKDKLCGIRIKGCNNIFENENINPDMVNSNEMFMKLKEEGYEDIVNPNTDPDYKTDIFPTQFALDNPELCIKK